MTGVPGGAVSAGTVWAQAMGAKKVALVAEIVSTCLNTLFGPFSWVPPCESARGMKDTFIGGKRASELVQLTTNRANSQGLRVEG